MTCRFNESWLDLPDFKCWLRKHESDQRMAFCVLCKSHIKLHTMGVGALRSHKEGKTHKKRVQAATGVVPLNLFQQHASSSRPSGASTSSSETSSATPTGVRKTSSELSVSSFCTSSDVLKAEVLWTLNIVTSHYSAKSCQENSQLFEVMFPDSQIAKGYKCGETKTSYLATFGIAPYFARLLKTKVKSQSSFVLLFDESLNKQVKENQLDVHVRFWENGTVQTQYMTSEFLGHSRAADLCKALEPTITELGYNKLLQLSMDGPNVNWAAYASIQKEMESQASKQMLQTGSCGIHIVHNAFKAGCNAAGSDWDMEDFLTKLYILFLDCPARRDDFVNVTRSSIFPLKFCKVRWLENIAPAERALEIIENVVAYCTAAKSKKVTEPNNMSYETVKKAIQDPLLVSRLHFFIMVAREVQPFLVTYQTDKPMLPFITTDLVNLLKTMMTKFLKEDVLETEGKTVSGLSKIDVKKLENHLPLEKIKVGYLAEKQLTKSNLASDRQKLKFRGDCKQFLITLVHKLLLKAPIKFPLVRSIGFLDPRLMAQKSEKANNTKKLTQTLNIMTSESRVKDYVCDQVLSQFDRFLNSVLSDHSLQFSSFDPNSENSRVDVLLHSHLAGKKMFADLWSVVQDLLLLSHGQATVERGFSINKETTADNLSQIGLIARRQIIDHTRLAGGVLQVPINKELLTCASSARSKYHAYLDAQKQEEGKAKRGEKRKQIEENVSDLKLKKGKFEKEASYLIARADKLAEDAEVKDAPRLLSESNALRKKGKERKADVDRLEKEILKEMECLKDAL
ncbi:hypothetical protein ACOMHN_052767 [Nucella lapillus]